MLIKCYHPTTFETTEIITNFTSLQWIRRFYDVGSFELHLPKTNLCVNSLIKIGDKDGIVLKIVDNFEEIAVYGYDLKGLTNFRYIDTTKNYTALKVENVYKALATDFLCTGNRLVQGLNIAPIQNRGVQIDWSAYDVFLSENLKELGTQYGIGYNISFDETQMIFDVVESRDISNKIVFSRDYRNVDNEEYTIDYFNTYNTAVVLDGTPTGIETGIYRREGVAETGKESELLNDKKVIETLTAEANNRLTYGVDYRLGDFVTVKYKGYSIVLQITEIKEVYEPNCTKILPVFGEQKENPIKKILR